MVIKERKNNKKRTLKIKDDLLKIKEELLKEELLKEELLKI